MCHWNSSSIRAPSETMFSWKYYSTYVWYANGILFYYNLLHPFLLCWMCFIILYVWSCFISCDPIWFHSLHRHSSPCMTRHWDEECQATALDPIFVAGLILRIWIPMAARGAVYIYMYILYIHYIHVCSYTLMLDTFWSSSQTDAVCLVNWEANNSEGTTG